ncbi:receptor-like protein kinase [Tripterygium wilfordii]|uniref:Receptor-like protein kinase n=1 Tax=Tripterygium wilfordii TaxID=458696 RepID=A0A7J7D7R3_TRIWF|nr:rust resistance kinase Lr10-like [Tripterygium wilfordii]KAF5742387.1 receptor-like protein kinase [Tripterygium wilfordii]
MGISYQMLVYLFWLILAIPATGQDECSERKCGRRGPAVRFPFKIKGRHPNHCGYPGFDISCNEKQQPVLELPDSVKLLIKKIKYKSQVIHVYDSCLPRSIRYLNISASPFNYFDSYLSNYTFFKCSDNPMSYRRVNCLESSPVDQVFSVSSNGYIYDSADTILNCSKMYDILSAPYDIVYGGPAVLQLNWIKPDCWKCESVDKRCRLLNTTSTKAEIECYGRLREKTDVGKILLITGSVLGAIIVVLLLLAFYRVHRAKRIQEENQARVEQFLEDYKAFKPARYTYNDIKTITDDFKDKLGQGGYGTVYKGKLSNEVTVAVKILINSKGDGVEFINEVATMGRIHHVNVVRLVGYCADGYRRALVYEYLPNDSLEKFIFSENGKDQSLSWEKLHSIALDIGKGIEYLHQGCEQRIVHFDIKPHNILLDQNFNPKICDFGLAKLCSKDQSAVSMTAARGTMGYIAPEVFSRNFGNASHKSDVYSFGMLLLEMVGGRKNVDVTADKTSQVFFPEWVYNKLSQGEEPVIRIGEDVDAPTARKLMIVGLWCIQWNPVDRPSMRVVVQMLEGEDDNLTLPPNPFAANNGARMNTGMPGMPFHEHHLTVISEAEESI